MRFTTTLLTTGLLTLVSAQNSFPSCIQDCIASNPTSSTCTGEETGQDLADCTCDSIRGSGLLECMGDCAPEDQTDYADILDGACREELFPDVGGDGDDSDDNDESDNNNGSDDSNDDNSNDDNNDSSQSGDDNGSGEDAAAGVKASVILAGAGAVAALFM